MKGNDFDIENNDWCLSTQGRGVGRSGLGNGIKLGKPARHTAPAAAPSVYEEDEDVIALSSGSDDEAAAVATTVGDEDGEEVRRAGVVSGLSVLLHSVAH